jgi:methylenetetrahydrofolate reductase (NADPH)
VGIKVPIVAGIMPILNVGQIKRFVSMCGSKIPQPLLTKLEGLEANPEAVHDAGVDYATQQCKDLLANGCEGIHFYTLNRSKATVQICKELKPQHAA